jgi:predicted component of type VI protein secretion system
MNDKDREKLHEIVGRLKAILEELRKLAQTTEDPLVKQMANSAAMILAWIDLISNFGEKGHDTE